MSRDDEYLSAYLDNEVPEPYATQISEQIASDSSVRQRYNRLSAVSIQLQQLRTPDYESCRKRVWQGLMDRVGTATREPLWRRHIGVPLPALAAAAVAVLVVAGVLIWSSLQPIDAREYLAGAQDVDVTIRVDSDQMEEVMQWLVQENMLGEVNIQLPSDQRFEIMGDPVMLRLPTGGGMQSTEPSGGVPE